MAHITAFTYYDASGPDGYISNAAQRGTEQSSGNRIDVVAEIFCCDSEALSSSVDLVVCDMLRLRWLDASIRDGRQMFSCLADLADKPVVVVGDILPFGGPLTQLKAKNFVGFMPDACQPYSSQTWQQLLTAVNDAKALGARGACTSASLRKALDRSEGHPVKIGKVSGLNCLR